MNAYLILDLSVNDFEMFKEYIEKIPAFIQKHDGRYIVQGVEPSTAKQSCKFPVINDVSRQRNKIC